MCQHALANPLSTTRMDSQMVSQVPVQTIGVAGRRDEFPSAILTR